MKINTPISRRSFLGSASLLAVGTSLVSFRNIDELVPLDPDKKAFWTDLSSDEKSMVESSFRAKYIVGIEGKSCAEKVLLTTIKSFKKPEKLGSFAASFGGGLKKGDLCGLLTGAFMSIGFASERLIKDEEERADWVNSKTAEMWSWWEERAPRHCNELRGMYADTDKAVHNQNFNNMCQRMALKLDEMFEKKA